MLSEYQLKITDSYHIPISNVEKLVPNFFFKEVYASLWKFAILLENRIKTKKIHHLLEFNQLQWLKPYIEFNIQKRIEAKKLMAKMEKYWTN